MAEESARSYFSDDVPAGRLLARGMNAGHGVMAYFHDNTATEWQVMLTEFKKSLDKFQVPAREQQELIAVVESTKKYIVIAAARP